MVLKNLLWFYYSISPFPRRNIWNWRICSGSTTVFPHFPVGLYGIEESPLVLLQYFPISQYDYMVLKNLLWFYYSIYPFPSRIIWYWRICSGSIVFSSKNIQCNIQYWKTIDLGQAPYTNLFKLKMFMRFTKTSV